MPTKQELTDFADANNVAYPEGASKAEIENALQDAGYDPQAPEANDESAQPANTGTAAGTSSTQTSGASPGSEGSTGSLRGSDGMDTQAAEGVQGDPDGEFPPGWVIDAAKDPGNVPSGASQQEANLHAAQVRAHEGYLSGAEEEAEQAEEDAEEADDEQADPQSRR